MQHSVDSPGTAARLRELECQIEILQEDNEELRRRAVPDNRVEALVLGRFCIGHVRTTYAKLVDCFGPPTYGPDSAADGFTVTCRWHHLSFTDTAGAEHTFSIDDREHWRMTSKTPSSSWAWQIVGEEESHMDAIRNMVPRLLPVEGKRYVLYRELGLQPPTLKIFMGSIEVHSVLLHEALREWSDDALADIEVTHGSFEDIAIEGNWSGNYIDCDWELEMYYFAYLSEMTRRRGLR